MARYNSNSPDWGAALQKLQQSKEQGGATAALVFFVPGTDEAKAKRWLDEAIKRGILTRHVCHQYDDAAGGPVWYIP